MNDWLIFLLLFACLSFGWFIGRYQTLFHLKNSTSPSFSSRYFKGLNYLLNEQPDQAIDQFITMLEDDSESVDLQLVLAQLFRNKGELERAIAIHQRLLVRPELSDKLQVKVKLELARDFFSAGLHDRAEQTLKEVIKQDRSEDALALLFSVWASHKDWQSIVSTAEGLKQIPSSLIPSVVGACCSLSDTSADYAKYLDYALKLQPDSVMVNFSLANRAFQEGNVKKALKRLNRVVALDSSMVQVVLPLLKQCFQDKKHWFISYQSVLENWYQNSANMLLVSELIPFIEKEQGLESAIIFLSDYLKHQPSIPGLVQLIDLHLESGGAIDRSSVDMFRDFCSRITDQETGFQCRRCGYQAHQLYWQCPNCRRWETVKPIT